MPLRLNSVWESTPQSVELSNMARARRVLRLADKIAVLSGNRNVNEIMKYLPSAIPPDFDLVKNIERAKLMGRVEFYYAVRNGGEWDYKQKGSEYQEFGNVHYGVVARAAGFGEGISKRAAGVAQFRAGTWKVHYGVPGLTGASLGDDPDDKILIESGMYLHSMLPSQMPCLMPDRIDTPKGDVGPRGDAGRDEGRQDADVGIAPREGMLL